MEINRDLLFARVCEQFKREILSRLRLEVNAWMEKQTVGFTYWLGIQSASGYDAAQFLLQPDGPISTVILMRNPAKRFTGGYLRFCGFRFTGGKIFGGV